MDEFLAMKIELAKEEPFFDDPGGGDCPVGNRVIGDCPVGNRVIGDCPVGNRVIGGWPVGNQAFGYNELVRQEQKIQARFCNHHL